MRIGVIRRAFRFPPGLPHAAPKFSRDRCRPPVRPALRHSPFPCYSAYSVDNLPDVHFASVRVFRGSSPFLGYAYHALRGPCWIP